jgi:hypothetical protein
MVLLNADFTRFGKANDDGLFENVFAIIFSHRKEANAIGLRVVDDYIEQGLHTERALYRSTFLTVSV